MVWLIVTGLSLIAILYTVQLGARVVAARARPRAEALVVGAVTNFFDTLGIGSFAPTIAWFRFRRLVPDRLIPLTMLAGYILSSLLQGVIFLILLGVGVDPWLILGSTVAMALGAMLGVPLAARAPIRLVQALVGLALLAAAFTLVAGGLGWMPAGGTATSLPLGLSLVVVALHLLLGILCCFGVGNYAPTLAVLSLMGMDPRLAFPIMATAAGVAGATAASRALRTVELDVRIVLGLVLGAIPAVLVAAFIVKELPLDALRWLVVAVVSYAAITLLAAAARPTPTQPSSPEMTAIAG